MAKYRVETDQGTYEVETEEKGMLGKAWDALAVPEQKSREGLKMIADAVPSVEPGQPYKSAGYADPQDPEYHKMLPPSVMNDAISNTPKILANTLAEVAPSFVSRGAIVTGGLLKGAGKAAQMMAPAVGQVARTLEGTSGLENVNVKSPAGLLSETFNDPTLPFATGSQKAARLYGDVSQGVRQELRSIGDSGKFVDKALDLAQNGGLNANEAINARRELDGIKNNLTDLFYGDARKVFDAAAKTGHAEADAAFVRGLKADALRSLAPLNKNGTVSKVGAGFTWLNPKAAILTSPLVQSMAASALGAAAKAGGVLAKTPLGAAAAGGIAEEVGRLVRQPKDKRGVVDYKQGDRNGK